MTFSRTNCKNIADFKIASVSGSPALSGYILRFGVEYTTFKSEDNASFLISDFFAKIQVNRLFLGNAFPEVPFVIEPLSHNNQATISFDMVLTPQTIEAIERLRRGGDLQFNINIVGLRNEEKQYTHQNQEIKHLINQKAWINILKGMNYGSHILFEYPVDFQVSGDIKEATGALEEAKELFYYGKYDSAVTECRKVFEFALEGKNTNRLMKEMGKPEDRKQMTKNDRMDTLFSLLRHITNLAPHKNENENAPFSRDETILIIGSATAALSFKSMELKHQASSD